MNASGRLGKAVRAQAVLRNTFRIRGISVTSTVAWKRPAREPEWLKDIDVSRTVENLLTGAIVFAGRLPYTAWWLLVHPRRLDKRLLFDTSLKTVAQVTATRPLTFLAVNLFLYVVLMLVTIGELKPFSPFLTFFKPLLSKIPTDFKSLSLESISLFMLPGVLIVGVFAATTTWIAKAVGMNASFKVMLNLHAYYTGLACFVIAVEALLLTPAWELVSWGEQQYGKDVSWYALPLVASGFLFVAALVATVLQLLLCVREGLRCGAARAALLLCVSWPTGFGLAWLVVSFLSPAFEHVGK